MKTNLQSALRARHITSSTVLAPKQTKELAKTLGVSEARLKDAIAGMPKKYDDAIGEKGNAHAERIVQRSVFDTGGSPSLGALFDPAKGKREAALPKLEQGAKLLEELTVYTGEERYAFVGHPIAASLLVSLSSVRDAVVGQMDKPQELDDAKSKSLGLAARKAWDAYSNLTNGDAGLQTVRGAKADPHQRALGMVLDAISQVREQKMVGVDELFKKPGARAQLVEMLGELATNPARLKGYESVDPEQLKWFHAQVRALANA